MLVMFYLFKHLKKGFMKSFCFSLILYIITCYLIEGMNIFSTHLNWFQIVLSKNTLKTKTVTKV